MAASPEQAAVLRVLILEGCTQLAVFLLRVVETTFDLSSQDRGARIKKGLTYGEMEPSFCRAVMVKAYSIADQALKVHGGTELSIDPKLFEMPIPEYADDIVSLVEALVRTPALAATVPYLLDLTLWNIVMGDPHVVDITNRYDEGALALAANVRSFMSKWGLIPDRKYLQPVSPSESGPGVSTPGLGKADRTGQTKLEFPSRS